MTAPRSPATVHPLPTRTPHPEQDRAAIAGRDCVIAGLRDIGWLDRTGTPYQRVVDQGLMTARVLSGPQVRITVRGLGRLHALMVGHPSTGAVRELTSR